LPPRSGRAARRGQERSPKADLIGLNDAAERLAVHYMTAYRYVRTGRLPAIKTAGEWRVDPADLERMLRVPAESKRGSGRGRAAEGMLARLLAGDELGAWTVAESALASGAQPADVHLQLLAPALRAIGERWRTGDLDVGDEHRASVVARRVIGRLGPRFNRRGRKRGVVLLGAVAGERHEIPGAMVADQLRGAGFEVADLGADTPAASFVSAAERLRPVCVLVSVTGSGHEAAVIDTVSALRAGPEAVLLVGGAAVPDEQTAVALGSACFTGRDAREVVGVVEKLVE
jgi:excisionase family DNA binding protein